jgi:hypothetical protein
MQQPVPSIDESKIAAAFDRIPESSTSHFFVNVDDSDPRITEEIATF